MATTERFTTAHRELAVADLGRDLGVTAGAGAGKTTVLVDRFVRIAREPSLGPERALAITFTRKAAVEMKERAVRQFTQSGETALRHRTEAAYISTIHGLAERLLRERPFEARIDPAFAVLTQYDQALFFEEALRRMYGDAELRALAPRLGREFKGGWKVFALVSEVSRLLREGPASAGEEAALVLAGDEDGCVERAIGRARDRVTGAGQRMLALLDELVPLLRDTTLKSSGVMAQEFARYLEDAEAAVHLRSVRETDPAIWKLTRFTGQVADVEHRAALRALLDPVKDVAQLATFDDWASQEILERELLPLKRAVYRSADAVARDYAAHKRRAGLLDFHDLQERAAAMLRDCAPVREEYASRFRHILLDEAQDTDELQYGIVGALRTPDNVLFVVGDPKQAIYEFRGANPDVFESAMGRLPEAARLSLPENFRSRAEVVAFVNAIGPALLADRFVRIDARAEYARPLAGPAVTGIWAIQRPLDEAGRSFELVGDVRPREAAAVAEEIAWLVASGTKVRDPESREPTWVRIRPRHVAVLFRTRTAIPYFEMALAERGIPYVTAAGQGFYERAEVLDCLMMLRVLAQPLDDLALAAVLRGPWFGCTDAALWRLRARGAAVGTHDTDRATRPLWYAMRRDAECAPVRETLDRLRRRTRGLPAHAALDAAVRELRYEAAVAAHDDAPAMLANLAKLRRQLRDLGGVTPLAAWQELERTRELMAAESLAPVVGPADDVVVLTTVHAAKGLEWPVVCLPNLQGESQDRGDGFSARHGMLLCDARDDADEAVVPHSVAAAREELRARADAEERRLLYVALTRARERLVLSASVKRTAFEPKEAGSFQSPFAFLARTLGADLAAEGERDVRGCPVRIRHVVGPVEERTRVLGGEPIAATIEQRVVDGLPPEAALPAALPLSVKVTELLAYRRCPQVHRFSHALEIEENVARRAAVRAGEERAPTPVELGTMVHALLERADFHAADLDAEIARLLAGERGELRGALERMLRPVLEGEVGRLVRGAARVEREWPVALVVGGVLMEGVVDLAVQDADGRWTVVDYKSNDFSRTGRLEYLVDHYTPQLELYARAIERAGAGEVAECALVFLAGPRVERWRFDGATAGVDAWAEETVARIAAGDYATTAGPKCEMCGYRKRKVCDTGRAWLPVVIGGAAVSGEPGAGATP